MLTIFLYNTTFTALCFKTTFKEMVLKFFFQKMNFGHLFLSFFENIYGLYFILWTELQKIIKI